MQNNNNEKSPHSFLKTIACILVGIVSALPAMFFIAVDLDVLGLIIGLFAPTEIVGYLAWGTKSNIIVTAVITLILTVITLIKKDSKTQNKTSIIDRISIVNFLS